jgi:hypothetical protein
VADQAQTTDAGLERIQSMFRSVEEEFEKLQNRVSKQRQNFEKSTQERMDQMQSDLRKTELFKRAASARKSTEKRFEANLDQVLGVFNIATRSDFKKLDRKLNQINRKLKGLDK